MRIRGRALQLALAAATVLAGGCGGEGPPSESTRDSITIGYSFGFDAGDVADQVAFRRLQQRGGPRAKLLDMGGAANAITAVIRGDVDAAIVPYVGAVEAAASGTGIRLVLGANMAAEFLLVGRPEIRRAPDLRGKTVAHSGPGTVTGTFAEAVARRAGLGSDDVRFRVIQESPARAAALVAGRIDAATMEFVDYERLKADHSDLHVIARLSDLQPRAPVMVWAVSEASAERRSDKAQTIVDGLLDGYEFAYTDAGRNAWLEEARRSALESDTPDLARRTYAYYRRIGFWPRRGHPFTKAAHDRIVRFWLEAELIEQAVAYGELWEPAFWRAAAGD